MTDDVLKGLPRRIQLGHLTVRIVVAPSSHEHLTEAYGCFFGDSQQIFIRDDLTPGVALNTVFHELAHAVCWLAGVTDGSTEEDFVTHGTNGLLDVLMRNPRLVTWKRRLMRRIKQERSLD